ncbi:hypothetical protein [Saccharothrix sp. ALI-22-I]|uniref:hypothetical protein n=1 Tax=Saccharothrix sp. ALI-22-I TaxID=1933778 RepID=UPI00117B87AB|nr:hypothetical protein [Saccharothrix sp. ALI-22-I]
MASTLVASTEASAASPDGAGARFAAQTERAGLNSAQAAALQEKVDGYLAQQGGTQGSANRIDFPDGRLIVALPGEEYARDLGASGVQPAGLGQCSYRFFCGWKDAHYKGDFWQRSKCGVYHEIPDGWNRSGSWWNNQSEGIRAEMFDRDYLMVYRTPPAGPKARDAEGDWKPIWYVWACG